MLSNDRIWKGGIYSWQPESGWFPAYRANQNARKEVENDENRTTFNEQAQEILLQTWPHLVPYTSFAAAILTGMGVSFAVPPLGWSCRSQGELIIATIWISSYLLSVLNRFIFNREALFGFTFVKDTMAKKLFVITFVKDLLAFLGTMAMVTAIQFGIYNSSRCYTKYGTEGLALPQQDATNHTLQAGLGVGGSYTVIVTFGVLVQLVIIPMLLLWRYYAAFRVFLQRDNGTSNFDYPRSERVLAFCWGLIGRVFGCGSRTGGSRTRQQAPRQDPDETDQEMHPVATNDGRTQRAMFHPQMPLGTNGAHEYLLSPSAAHFRERPTHQRASSNPSFSSIETSNMNTEGAEATTGRL